jgi:dUTP pyrophosphatase
LEISVKANHPWAGIPARATGKSFGYDLQTIRPEVIPPRATVVLPTGLVLAEDLPFNDSDECLPRLHRAQLMLREHEGVAMLVLPRGSTALKYGLLVANSPGLVDADYTGEIGVIVHNLRDEEVRLELGWRIAQLLFVRALLPTIVESDSVDARAERGGFGSTGN